MDTKDYFFPEQCVSITTLVPDTHSKSKSGEKKLVEMEIGRALTNYTSSEIDLIKGKDCSEVEKILCHPVEKDRKCIISSENLVLTLSSKTIDLFETN